LGLVGKMTAWTPEHPEGNIEWEKQRRLSTKIINSLRRALVYALRFTGMLFCIIILLVLGPYFFAWYLFRELLKTIKGMLKGGKYA